jgi:hypothetical protein
MTGRKLCLIRSETWQLKCTKINKMSPNHHSALACSGIRHLCLWVSLIWLAPWRVSAVDVGFTNSGDLAVVPVTLMQSGLQ